MGYSLTTNKQNNASVLECQEDSLSRPSTTGVLLPEGGSGVCDTQVAGGREGLSCSTLAKELDGNGGGGGSPSLDRYRPSSNKPSLPSPTTSNWSRQQKRGYHRVQSVLQYWQANGFQVLWVMLSTATDGDASKLAYHHQILRQRIERKLGYEGLQHYQVRTAEGNGVLHIFWAWRARDGFRQRSFYVEQDWLSRQWQDIHGAPIVWIARVRHGRASINKVSRYCMAQYVGQQSGYQYMSWSWGRTFGFPLVACWQWFKRHTGNKSRLLFWWSRFLFGGLVIGLPRAGQAVSMGIIRVKYKEWGSELWAIS